LLIILPITLRATFALFGSLCQYFFKKSLFEGRELKSAGKQDPEPAANSPGRAARGLFPDAPHRSQFAL
jgi:hypothetical protein